MLGHADDGLILMSFLDALKRAARPLVCPFEPIVERIPPGSSVFDIGCGSGFLLGLIAEQKQPRSLGGAEVAEGLVSEAKEYLSRKNPGIPMSIALYDGVNLPANVSEFDFVLLIDVLHHIPPDRQFSFLREVHSRLKPGATLILKDIDADSILCLANKLHDFVVTGEAGHELSSDRTRQILESTGFNIIDRGATRKLWYPHYWIVGAKPA